MDVETKYLRMIQGMKRRGGKEWTVYILRCGDGSLYTGIAKDVKARVKQHCEGRGAAYTRTRLPVELLYQQEGLTHSEALIREAQIKRCPGRGKKKLFLVTGSKRGTVFLSEPIRYQRILEAIVRIPAFAGMTT